MLEVVSQSSELGGFVDNLSRIVQKTVDESVDIEIDPCESNKCTLADFIRQLSIKSLEAVNKKRNEFDPASKLASAGAGDAVGAVRTIEDVIKESAGMKNWQRMNKYLSIVLEVRSPEQVRFHNTMLASIIPWVFRNEWAAYKDVILRLTGLDKTYSMDTFGVIVSMPRRFGKTTCMAAFCACALLACPGFNMLFLATTYEVAMRAKALTEKLLLRLIDMVGEQCVVDARVDFLLVSRPGIPPSQIVCLTQSLSTRGVSCDVVFCDEFGFMETRFIMSIVVPLLTNIDVKLIALSSPGETYGGHMPTFLSAMRANGKPLFDVFEVSSICPACRDKGASKCTHVDKIYTQWRPGDLEETLSVLFVSNKAMFEREILGAATYDEVPVFHKPMIEHLFDGSPTSTMATTELSQLSPDNIFIGIDPCGGGDSHTAWVSFCFVRSGQVIAARLVVGCTRVFIATPPLHCTCRSSRTRRCGGTRTFPRCVRRLGA